MYLPQLCYNIFAGIGAATTAYYMFKLFGKAYRALRIYGPLKSIPNLSRYGQWSVITGGTDGIGKAIAFELAAKKQNIILIARNLVKLRRVAQEISSTHGVQVKILKIDFSDDESIYNEIEEFLKDVDIGVLVNNVGVSDPMEDFLDFPDLSNHIRIMTRVNMISIMKMHQIVLPGMVGRKRGLILNISSTTSLQPMFAIYGATKAFVNYFSEALSYEYERKGVTIQRCLPALVKTNMTADVPTNSHTVLPDDFAKSLVSTIGKERLNHGCFTHEVVGWMMVNMPVSLFVWIWRRVKDAGREQKKIT